MSIKIQDEYDLQQFLGFLGLQVVVIEHFDNRTTINLNEPPFPRHVDDAESKEGFDGAVTEFFETFFTPFLQEAFKAYEFVNHRATVDGHYMVEAMNDFFESKKMSVEFVKVQKEKKEKKIKHLKKRCKLYNGKWICPPDCPVEARGENG